MNYLSRKTRKEILKHKVKINTVGKHKNDYFTYMLITTKGLEDIVISEIKSKITDASVLSSERGKIYVNFSNDCLKFSDIKTIENFYVVIGRIKIGTHKADLNNLSDDILTLNLRRYINEFYFKRNGGKNPKIIVSASRSGKHNFSRYEAADRIQESLCNHLGFIRGSIDNHDMAFRADITDDNLLFSLKLSKKEFKYRGHKEFSQGALKPTVAHAMVLLSKPSDDDVFLDPFCGSGTIPLERCFYPYKKITASDISEKAVAISKSNIKGKADIIVADACNLPFSSHSVSKIVTNPPWDVQIKVEDIQKLYVNFLYEAKRILIKGGNLVMLTDKEEILKSAANMTNFNINKIATISLHGLLPSIFLLIP